MKRKSIRDGEPDIKYNTSCGILLVKCAFCEKEKPVNTSRCLSKQGIQKINGKEVCGIYQYYKCSDCERETANVKNLDQEQHQTLKAAVDLRYATHWENALKANKLIEEMLNEEFD